MLVKIQADDVLVDQLKVLTGEVTGSKAFQVAAASALSLTEQVADLRRRVKDLETTVQVQRRTLRSARSAAVQLLEISGQEDLFHV